MNAGDTFHLLMMSRMRQKIEHAQLAAIATFPLIISLAGHDSSTAQDIYNALERRVLYWQNLLDRYCTRMKL